jgi:hypothetical protein
MTDIEALTKAILDAHDEQLGALIAIDATLQTIAGTMDEMADTLMHIRDALERDDE